MVYTLKNCHLLVFYNNVGKVRAELALFSIKKVFSLHLASFILSILLLMIVTSQSVGVSNGPIQFKSARKIWPLLELLAKITQELACSCLRNFCNCSHARIFVTMHLIA